MKRRVAYWMIAIVALIAIGLVTVYVFEQTRGDLDWEEYVKEARNSGKKITVLELYPARIPDDENFAAAPLFIRHAAGNGSNSEFGLGLAPGLDLSDLEKGCETQFEPWVKHFRKKGWLSEEQTSDHAGEVLKVLERFNPLILELKVAAERPRSQFPDGWIKAGPHTHVLRDANRLLSLHAIASIAHEAGYASIDDVRLLLRISHHLKEEPGIIGAILFQHPTLEASDIVWQGLIQRSWGDDELVQIGNLFEQLDVLHQTRWQIESERAWINANYDKARRAPVGLKHAIRLGRLDMDELLRQVIWVGWMGQNRTRTNRYVDDLLGNLDETRSRYRFEQSKWGTTPRYVADQNVGEVWDSARFAMSKFAMSKMAENRLNSAIERGLRLHTRVQQVKAACAVERYRIKYGSYPERIEALVPEFLDSVPRDVCDGEPMRYRLDAKRRYILHSIGADRKDDGGVPPDPKRSRRNPDWVWTYPPQ